MDDDLEEMRALRASRDKGNASRYGPKPASDRISSAPGSSGEQKKARSFDINAMIEQARKTAAERSATIVDQDEQPDFDGDQEHDRDDDKNLQDVSRIMGFSSFGGEKKIKSVDVKAAYEQTRKVVQKKPKNLPGNENFSDSDDDVIGPPLPPSMQQSSKEIEEDDTLMRPPLRPGMKSASVGDGITPAINKVKLDEEDEEDSDEDDDNPVKKIPSSHEVVLNHGYKTVSALALDPSGARVVSGGYDYDVKLWDFAGMDASLRSFRQLRPCESHVIKSLEYSSTGDQILVVAGNCQAKVIDRDGFEIMECPKGDQYITDMANTKGHAAMLNSGCWNPKVKEEFMTCSNDGSVRLWDVNKGQKHKNCIKTKNQQGRRTIPTTCAFSRDGRYVAAGCQDGSIQIWDHNKNFVNTAMVNRNAHMMGTDPSSLCFSYDGKLLASRGGDDTVKTWDIRNFKKPLAVAENLLNLFSMTDCVFSPDDQLIVTGVSLNKNETDGKLVFLDRNTLQQVYVIQAAESNIVRCLWHPKLNQIVLGCGDGKVKVFYDPDKSSRGAKLCVVKTKRKVQQIEMMADQNIITPHALPMFRQARPTSTRKQEEKARKDPLRSHRPDLPVSGPGQGGRLGAKGATLSQYVVQQLVKRKPDDRDKDPRAAILRHAEEAEKNPFWVTPAYTATQPDVIFQEEEEEEDKEDDEPVWKKAKV